MPSAIFREKRQQYLAFLLLIAILIGAIWFLWPKISPSLSSPLPPLKPKKVEINFEVLKKEAIKDLRLFEKITPFEEEIGRENPFSPY